MATWKRVIASSLFTALAGFTFSPDFVVASQIGRGSGFGQLAPEPGDTIHSPPVTAVVIDPFRAPEHAFGPGNRGLEYGTAPGQLVAASANGVVSFAGQVGGNLFVTVDHGGGLRTTVGLLAEVLVTSGDNVTVGSPLGLAGGPIHFSARQDGDYFDPELLFGSFQINVRLVPGPD